jgi:hypothetical protein
MYGSFLQDESGGGGGDSFADRGDHASSEEQVFGGHVVSSQLRLMKMPVMDKKEMGRAIKPSPSGSVCLSLFLARLGFMQSTSALRE